MGSRANNFTRQLQLMVLQGCGRGVNNQIIMPGRYAVQVAALYFTHRLEPACNFNRLGQRAIGNQQFRGIFAKQWLDNPLHRPACTDNQDFFT